MATSTRALGRGCRIALLTTIAIAACEDGKDEPESSTSASVLTESTSTSDVGTTITFETQSLSTSSTTTTSTLQTDATSSTTDTADLVAISGMVRGLQGKKVWLRLNAQVETLGVDADGEFAFPEGLPLGASYDVSVASDPLEPAQTCAVQGGQGVAGNEAEPIVVTCITPVRYVVLIGISGLRTQDIARMSKLPQIAARGHYHADVATAWPLEQTTQAAALLTGEVSHVHGVDGEAASWKLPTWAELAVATDTTRKVGLFAMRDGLWPEATADMATHVQVESDRTLLWQNANDWLSEKRPAQTLLFDDSLRLLGERDGWGSQHYFEELDKLDQRIDALYQVLEAKKMLPHTALVITSMGGGEAKSGQEDTLETRRVPSIVLAPQLEPGSDESELRLTDLGGLLGRFAGVGQISAVARTWPWATYPTGELAKLASDAKITFINAPAHERAVAAYYDQASGSPALWFYWNVSSRMPFDLGDVPSTAKVASDAEPLWLVDGDDTILAAPLGFERRFASRLQSAARKFVVWEPIAPVGYRCLGSVASTDPLTSPARPKLRCVHQDALVKVDAKFYFSRKATATSQGLDVFRCVAQAGDAVPMTTTGWVAGAGQLASALLPTPCMSFLPDRVEMLEQRDGLVRK